MISSFNDNLFTIFCKISSLITWLGNPTRTSFSNFPEDLILFANYLSVLYVATTTISSHSAFYISANNVARAVSCEDTYLAPNNKWMSSIASTQGLFFFKSLKMPLINYYAPPTTRESISTEDIYLQWMVECYESSIFLTYFSKALLPAPE